MKSTFRESINLALNNPNLTGALGRFSEAYRTGRAKAYEGIDFEALRERVVAVKSNAARQLDALAAAFQENAEARGAKVFRTDDPEQVKAYILALARDRGV